MSILKIFIILTSSIMMVACSFEKQSFSDPKLLDNSDGGSGGGGNGGGGSGGGGNGGGGNGGGGGSGGTGFLVSSIPKTNPNFDSKQNILMPSNLWATNTFPKTANRWWDNMVIDRYGDTYGNENPIATHPYIAKGTIKGLEICYPVMNIQTGYIEAAYLKNISFGASFGNFDSRKMDYANDFTFKMTWKKDSSTMSIPITRGSPYITAEYVGSIVPELESQHAIVDLENLDNSTKYKMSMNNGQIWILYSSSPITLTKVGNSTLRAGSNFTGTLQLALATDNQLEEKLDQYKLIYVTSGTVSYNTDKNQATINFDFETNNGGEPLLMGLPHHQDSGVIPSFSLTTPYSTVKGKMIPVVGKKWTLTEDLPTIGFFSNRGVDSDKLSQILTALQSDKNLRPVCSDPGCDATNPYYFGKLMARMGRLALIAEQIGQNDIKNEIIETLKADLMLWINGTNSNPLRYDPVWGSIATVRGLDTPGADFGIGEHNDIHFHFGYFVYAFAVIARTDLAWVNQHKDWIYSLIRAYANPHTDDPYFPPLRHKDWYMGHSWASGIVSFGSGNNMESTSESVNSYYAIMLLGKVMNDTEMYEFGRVLTATEIRSAQKYWQIKSTNEIYHDIFKSKKVVGILWDTKVEYATWFGANVEWIHEIQMIPFTPISEILLPANWIQEEYPVLSSGLTRIDPPIEERWKGYVYMTHAIIDKAAAWTEVQSLTSFDNGNSRTNAYYWVATRPGTGTTVGGGMD